MQKKLALVLYTACLTLATDIYENPSSDAKVVTSLDSSHEYTIKTQDWVEITDESSAQHGWARLSELKPVLSSNSQWTYRWSNDSNGEHQTMHYKPFNEEDITRHVKRVHNQHKKIMAEFQSFWDEFEKTSESISKDTMSFIEEK